MLHVNNDEEVTKVLSYSLAGIVYAFPIALNEMMQTLLCDVT